MNEEEVVALRTAIVALEGQRGTLGDAVVELATAPLRARLAAMQRPAGLQRRLVTVLFADVVGSTAMAGALDAEDTLAVLSGTLQRMASLVEARQGRVLRFTGDGVKAVFGMDEAREDDAERAVRAGLAIVQAGREQAEAARLRHGIQDFAVRVGVHTGDVALGAGVEADSTAMGAAVNIAARMEQSAPPGALRISHDTWNHVRGLFEAQAQPPLLVKGVDAPMQTYLVHAALDRRVASVERGLQGLRTAMVGRQAELQRLHEAVAQARQTRHLQALTLLGDAGLGKSRLLREWTAQLQDCRLLALRCQPDGALRPWGLLRSLLAAECGVADTDSADVARRKVVAGLGPGFEDRGEPGESGERQAQLIGQLSGLDFGDSPHVRGLDPRSLRDQAFAALRTWLQGLAAQDPVLPVLTVEDLHWADDGSLDWLQDLQAHAAELPLVVLMSSRPALLTRRPEWSPAGSTVTLQALAAAHSHALAQALLERIDDVPAELTELIVGRAEGNPYYMEELVRRLVDDGVIDVAAPRWGVHLDRLQRVQLPGTLVGLLQARLDALPAGQRRAARQASVIGHVFWDEALRAVDEQAPQALPALQTAAIVKAHAASDFEGTAERQFDHHLLHQVTYDTLLKAERRLGHGAVARWLTERTQGRGAEFLAMTGEHAERAGEVALAVDCFDTAAREAQKRFANTAAMSWLRRALALLGDSNPARRFELLSRLEQLADVVGDRSGQDDALADMAVLLEQHPDDVRQARRLYALALLCERRSDSAASERHARQAFELAERCGAAMTAAKSQALLAYQFNVRQDFIGAGRHVGIGLQWAGRIEGELERADTEAQLLNLSGMVAFQLCRFDEARSTLQQVLARGEALGSPRVQLAALDNLAVAADLRGRWDEMAGWAERMRLLAHAVGAVSHLGRALHLAAVSAEGASEPQVAIDGHLQALAIFRTIGYRRMVALTLQRLGVLHLEQGDAEAALQWHAQALTEYEPLDIAVEACETRAFAALCETRLQRPGPALSIVEQLLDRLGGELADLPAHETILLRWTCQQVLEAVGDARATPSLERLCADVLARAVELTDEADRQRLIQALPAFRGVVRAHRRLGLHGAAG